MKRLTDKEYQVELRKLQRDNIYREKNNKLKKERDKYKPKLKLPSTSKLIAVYLFIVLNVVLVFAMVSMWHFGDLSYLGVLITDIAAQILTFYVYSQKALKENSKDGIVYELAMMDKQNEIDTENTSC